MRLPMTQAISIRTYVRMAAREVKGGEGVRVTL